MAKIQFKVSARTAQLIGRENVANAEGAVIELVKNSYDADASHCIIYFDNKYSSNPGKCRLFIIDNGEGMNRDIIENFWMTIGTNNKQNEYITKKGRIKTGEKGIGRFALDRLGKKTHLLTRAEHNIGYLWHVDWGDFDNADNTLEDISAALLEKTDLNIEADVRQILSGLEKSDDIFKKGIFPFGTIIEISDLADEWDSDSVKKLYAGLEVLIPPGEEQSFDIHLFSSLEPQKYGKVEPAVCDDFDYKIHAVVDKEKRAKITIMRNEYDLSRFPQALFERKNMQKEHYNRETFEQGHFVIERTLEQLLSGLKDVDEDNLLGRIGPFDFTLYFMKKASTKKDKERFLYRSFNRQNRGNWLKDFGGIKLFRDNFRVRPYGETDSSWEDWLDLGLRAAKSPAGIAKKDGGYKVRPNNVAGVITISRLTNINFEDKSSREGLQENRVFAYFKELILGIISEFERDRSYIARELNSYYEETHKSEQIKADADDIAKEVGKKFQRSGEEPAKEPITPVEKLSVGYLDQKEELEELKEEKKLLAVFASSGITIASFAHELQSLGDQLVSRVDRIEKLFSKYVTKEECANEAEHSNPFIWLEYAKEEDEKLRQWLNYSLNTIRKDKRRRKNINLPSYFKKFEESWKTIMESRGCEIEIINDNLVHDTIRIFEIDLDCIFNNLFINSLDAFYRKGFVSERERDITIHLSGNNDTITISYEDSGPGLSKDIVEPDRIFEALYTTKRDPKTGSDIGTGLGMWLVKSITEENGGEVQLLLDRKGFGIDIKLPIKYQGNNHGKV